MPFRRAPALVLLLIAGALGGCATTSAPRCTGGLRAATQDTLYFGTQRPGGVVSEAEWSQFLADTVAPAFPAGFTTWPAQGAWRGADGVLVREGSHVLRVLHRGETASDRAVQAVAAEYQRRFEQEAVLRVRAAACMSP